MKKLQAILIIAMIAFSGCTTCERVESPEKETQQSSSSTPIEALLAEEILLLSEALEPHPSTTEIVFEKVIPEDREKKTWFKVKLMQDKLPDDSVKMMEYELHIKQNQDEEWEVVDKEITNTECYRGETEEGLCI